MFLDKTLLLKGIAGVAAVGGVVGGGYFLREELGIVSSSKKVENKTNSPASNTQQNGADETVNQTGKQVTGNTATDTQGPKGKGADAGREGAGVGDRGASPIGSSAPAASVPTAEEIAKQKKDKMTEINGKLDALGLGGCHLQDTDLTSPTVFSKDCELDQEKLQIINFSNKGSGNVTVAGLSGNVKLNIANKEGSDSAIKYTFKDVTSKITISGDQEKPYITLKNGASREFEDKNGKLSKVPSSGASNATTLNAKLKNLKIPNKCWYEEGESESSIDCELDQAGLQKIPFSNKGNTDVTVTGLTGNIKLKIEKKNNNNEIKYTFKDVNSKLTIKGDQTKANITLKPNETREFEDKNGKLTKVSKNSNKSNIQGANKKLTTINIPAWCRFEEEDYETSLECDFSDKTNDLKKIMFLNKTSSSKDLTINGSTTGLKLTINRFENKEGEKKYQTGVDLEFLFSGYKSEIKIQEDATFSSYSDIALKPNIITPLTISAQSKLAKAFNESTLAGRVGLSCTSSGSPITCTPLNAGEKVNILNSEGTDIEKINVEAKDKDTQIVKTAKDVEGYEQGIKFTITNNFPSTDPKLTTNSTYEAKYVTGKGWALSKKNGGR